MRYEDDDFYVDLVFYHSFLKCHVLIDLKLGKLTHGDVGQMDSYIRMFDAQYKRDDDNPTIGLILCSEKMTLLSSIRFLPMLSRFLLLNTRLHFQNLKNLHIRLKWTDF